MGPKKENSARSKYVFNIPHSKLNNDKKFKYDCLFIKCNKSKKMIDSLGAEKSRLVTCKASPCFVFEI